MVVQKDESSDKQQQVQHRHADQESDERLAVARWWKWSRDEDGLGPAEARRHRRWSHAGVVSVDHDGESWWSLQELPAVRHIPTHLWTEALSANWVLLSWYFLEALKSSACQIYKWRDLWWVHVCVRAFHSDGFRRMLRELVVLNISMEVLQHFYSWQKWTIILQSAV